MPGEQPSAKTETGSEPTSHDRAAGGSEGRVGLGMASTLVPPDHNPSKPSMTTATPSSVLAGATSSANSCTAGSALAIATPKPAQVYENEEGTGVDVAKVGQIAALVLE